MKKLRAFGLPFEQNRPRGDPVKTEYDSAKDAALAESDERKPLMVSLHRPLAGGSENVSGYFCGSVR